MITDKRAFVALCAALLIVALLALALVSCEETKEDFSALDTLENNNADENRDAAYGEGSVIGYYRIVLSGACSSEVSDAAHALKGVIEQATGVTCGVTYDAQQAPYRSDAVEILIGNTTRNSSRVALEGMRSEDYVCRWIDGSLVIGGISSSATLTALERFADEILPYAAPSGIMSVEQEFSYFHSYELDSVKLCGFEISDYCIVSSEQTMRYAFALAGSIAQKSGYALSAECREVRDAAKEIVLLIDGSSNANAYIEYNGEDVVIRAKDEYGVSVALERLCAQLLESGGKTAAFDIQSQIGIPYVSPEIKSMNIVSDIPMRENSISEINEVISKISAELPDVIVIDGMDSDVLDMVLFGISSDYSCAKFDQSDECVVAILHRTKTVKATLAYNQTENGSSAVKICLTHIASGEEYQFIALCGDSYADVTVLADAIANNVSNADNAAVVVLTSEDPSGAWEASSVGLIARHNSRIELCSAEYRSELLGGKSVNNGDVSVEYSSAQNAAFVGFTLAKTCFSGFSEYIQQ